MRIWYYSFSLVSALMIFCLIIYGFDLTIPEKGARKALVSQVNNTGQTNYYYSINDTFAFGVFTDREEGEYDIIVTSYERDVIPFCFICGWYSDNLDDHRGMRQPYLKGDTLYAAEKSEDDWAGSPAGTYPVINIKTGRYGYISDLSLLGADAADVKYKVSRNYVSANFDEISFSSSDDEDCYISFGGVFLCYIILAIWLMIWLVIRAVRKNNARRPK